jgi:hypothetical protein
MGLLWWFVVVIAGLVTCVVGIAVLEWVMSRLERRPRGYDPKFRAQLREQRRRGWKR